MSIVHVLDLDSSQAFACAQAGCQACQEALLRRHAGLVHAVVRRQASGALSYQELLQAGRIGLWCAVLGYDPGRGFAFSTYAWIAIERKIWSAVRQASRRQSALEPTAAPDPRALAEERLWWGEVMHALAEAVDRLPERQRELIRAVCGWEGGPPRSLSQIGQAWGMSRQGACYWYQQALVLLRCPAVSGRLRHLWGQDTQASYQRSQALSRAWRRRRHP